MSSLPEHPLLPIAYSAAIEAGAFLVDERPEVLQIDTKSSRSDSVTEMDRGSEQRIVARIFGARPDDAFLGEESGERAGTSGVRWVVDPLDGTVNYLYRLPMWGVSIAAEQDGEVVVGVVALPEFGEVYVGVRGAGSWLVRGDVVERLRVSAADVLDDALVSTGFAYSAATREEQAAVVAGLIGHIRDIRRTGCAVVDMCWLARGRIDAHYERNLNPWDYSAAGLIAEEAGAVVSDLDGGRDLSRFLVVAAPGIANSLITRLR